MKIILENAPLLYDVQCVCLLFFPRVSFSENDGKILEVRAEEDGIFVSFTDGKTSLSEFYPFEKEYDFFRTAVKTAVYGVLCKVTGKSSPWGIITGIRPALLYEKTKAVYGDKTEEVFRERYLVSEEKTRLCRETLDGRRRAIDENRPNDVSIYISIPFCPSRCHYCSFVSSATEKERKLLPEYVSLLCEEMAEVREKILSDGKNPTTIYVGGGTPSVLDEKLTETLLSAIEKEFLKPFDIKEFTFEAGRPDTVTEEKLKILAAHGVGRISINPQTLNNAVLEKIGRRHTAEDFFGAYSLAEKYPFIINTDLIAGLPGDTSESFRDTVDKIFSLSPGNVTVHTLYLKRSADFGAEENVSGVTKAAEKTDVSSMLSYVDKKRREEEYFPYYLYKQKNTVGNNENIGFAKKGKECLYNIYMMDDVQDIYGVGAGAVTKKIDPVTHKAERRGNTKFAYNYIKERSDVLKKQ